MSKAQTSKANPSGDRTVATNRRARFDYEITDTVEAGLVLAGTEVKSLRNGACSLSDAYGLCKDGQVFVVGMKIDPYSHGNRMNHGPDRTRKLLLNHREIEHLAAESLKGLQLVPMRVYFKNGLAKLELGVGRPRKLYDKRHAIRERDMKRDARSRDDD